MLSLLQWDLPRAEILWSGQRSKTDSLVSSGRVLKKTLTVNFPKVDTCEERTFKVNNIFPEKIYLHKVKIRGDIIYLFTYLVKIFV